jgi:hypothetical protein
MLNKCDLEQNEFDKSRLKALEPDLIETSIKDDKNILEVLKKMMKYMKKTKKYHISNFQITDMI